MTFEQLRYVVTIQQQHSLSAAADVLHLSPAAVSKALTRLEEEPGATLFSRSNSGATITPIGSQVLDLAIQAVSLEEQIRKLCGASPYPTPLKLEVYPLSSISLLSSAITTLQDCYPGIEIEVNNSSVTEIVSHLEAASIHLGLLCCIHGERFAPSPQLKYYSLFTSPWCALTSATSPLAKQPFATPVDLLNYPMILNSDPTINHFIKELFAPLTPPKPILRTNAPNLVRETILRSNAFTAVVELFFRLSAQVEGDRLACIPIHCNGQPFALDFVCCCNVHHQLSPAEQALIPLLRTTFSKYT